MEMPQCVYVCVSQRCQVISGLFAAKWQAFFSPPSLVLFFFFLSYFLGGRPSILLPVSPCPPCVHAEARGRSELCDAGYRDIKIPEWPQNKIHFRQGSSAENHKGLLCLECTICVSEHLSNQHRSSPNSHKIYGLKSTSINLWIQVFSVPVLTYSEGETSHRNILLFVPYCKYTF